MREASNVYDGVLDLRSMHSPRYTSVANSWVEQGPNGVHQKIYQSTELEVKNPCTTVQKYQHILTIGSVSLSN